MIHKQVIHTLLRVRGAVRPQLIMMTALFALSSTCGNLLLLVTQADAATTETGFSITIGSYNVLTDRWTGTGYGSRASDIAKNIKALGMDVVSMQEFESSRGADKIIKELGSDWDSLKDIGAAPALDGFGLAFAWDKTKVKMTEEDWVSTVDGIGCGGGSSKARIVKFQTTSGQDFYVADYHGRIGRSGSCSDARANNTEKVIKKLDELAGTTIPAFIAGDTNSWPSDKGGGIYPTVKKLGWGIADETAAQKSGGEPKIDRIFYSTKTTSSPTSFKRSDCSSNSAGTGSCGSDHKPIAANFGAKDTNVSLTIGTYNILGYYHGEGSKYNPARLKQIVSNINSMGYDVLGLQEYRNQQSGNAKELEDELKALNSSWTMSYSDKAMGSGFDDDQLNLVYNSSTVSLVEDTSIKAISSRTSPCDSGGTGAARITKFTSIANGQEFMLINVHPTPNHDSSACDDERLSVVKGVLANEMVAAYSGPLFIVGDFNANPTGDRMNEKNVEQYFKSVGFANARDIPGAIRKDGGVIDHVYYKTSSVAEPTSYETMDCKSISEGDPTKYTAATTCASDHHPVKAVFGGGGCSTLTEEQRARFKVWNGGILYYGPECTCSENAAGSSSGAMSGNNNFQKLATYMSSKGLSKYAIAGILGNWYSESTMSPFINEKGGGNFPNQGYGLAQWTNGRRTKVLDALKASLASQQSETIKSSFATYYAARYAGWPPITDWKAEGMGVPDNIPSEINDAWLKAEVDYMLTEFPAYKIGAAYYLSTLKQYVQVNDSDYLLDALNGAKSAGDAATIFSIVFEIHQGLDPKQNPRAETAEAMIATIETLVGSSSGNCSQSTPSTDLSSISLDGIDPATLPEPKGVNHDSWTSSTMDVAKILWHLFPNDFTAFSTRSSGGAVATSCHFKGLAIDMMIANYKDSTVRAKHEAIAEWLMKNRGKLGITNIIYYEKSFSVWGDNTDKPYSQWSSYSNPGGNDDTSAHRNHIHISIEPCKG